jgi:type IV fimbrial biogenesis protein FimT
MNRRQHGLTLIEMLVTLAVAIVLLAIGIPAFQGMEANNRAAVLAQGLVSALTLARTEALGRGVPVAVCPKDAADVPGQVPSTTCGTNANWPNGWLVFTDAAGTVGARDGTDEVVRDFPTPRRTPSITKAPAFVRFGTQGYLSDGTLNVPAAVNLQLAESGGTSNQTRCVTIASLGQPRTERKACP